jgi:putative methanogenesis marker protein 17
MLKIFWQKFGKDRVEQPDRFTVILYNVEVDAREIEDLVVADPSESLFKDLIYAFRLIAPEGFRVRSEMFSKEKFSFVASEDTLAEDLNPLIREKFALVGEKP